MAARAFAVIYSRSVLDALAFYTRLGFEETFRLPPEGEPRYLSLRERIAYVRDPDGNPVALATPVGKR